LPLTGKREEDIFLPEGVVALSRRNCFFGSALAGAGAAVALLIAAGCVAEPAKLAPANDPLAVRQAPLASQPAEEWNIFPDPLTGQVEIYHQGKHVGSITGEEPEDPPIPRKRD
jgi:hypothetical protein